MKNIIKNFLEKLVCKHDWEKLECIKVRDHFFNVSDLPIYHIYLYKCKKCGKFKKIKL